MMPSKRQMTGQNAYNRRQPLINVDQKSETTKTYEASVDDLIEDDKTFRPSGTNLETPTNLQPTRSTDKTDTKTTKSLGLHPGTNHSITFESTSKFKDKIRFTLIFGVLGATMHLDKKHKTLYARFALGRTISRHF